MISKIIMGVVGVVMLIVWGRAAIKYYRYYKGEE